MVLLIMGIFIMMVVILVGIFVKIRRIKIEEFILFESKVLKI